MTTRWAGQKDEAVATVLAELQSGPKTVAELKETLGARGVSKKNALKAIYMAVNAGGASVDGDYHDASIVTGGA